MTTSEKRQEQLIREGPQTLTKEQAKHFSASLLGEHTAMWDAVPDDVDTEEQSPPSLSSDGAARIASLEAELGADALLEFDSMCWYMSTAAELGDSVDDGQWAHAVRRAAEHGRPTPHDGIARRHLERVLALFLP